MSWVMFSQKGEYKQAIADFTRAIAMTSDNKKAIRLWHELGYVLEKVSMITP